MNKTEYRDALVSVVDDCFSPEGSTLSGLLMTYDNVSGIVKVHALNIEAPVILMMSKVAKGFALDQIDSDSSAPIH